MYNNVKKFSDYTYYLEFMKIVSTVKNRNIETLAINLSRYFSNFLCIVFLTIFIIKWGSPLRVSFMNSLFYYGANDILNLDKIIKFCKYLMFIKFVTAIIYYTLFRSIPLAIQHSFTIINLIYYGGKIADRSGLRWKNCKLTTRKG